MTLADHIRPELCTDLVGRDPPSVLLELSRVLQRGGVIPDALSFVELALHRYYLGETMVFDRVALVTIASPLATNSAVALGRATHPLKWRGEGSDVVWVMMAIAPATSATFLHDVGHLAAALGGSSDGMSQLGQVFSAAGVFGAG